MATVKGRCRTIYFVFKFYLKFEFYYYHYYFQSLAEYVYRGCWKDKGDARAMPEIVHDGLDGDYGQRKGAIMKCFNAAVDKGLKVYSCFRQN